MGTIAAMSRAWSQINLAKEAMIVVSETQQDIIELNQDQLKSGELKTSQRIRPKYRNPYYARKKNSQNPLPGLGTPDLHNTGEFYKGFTIRLQGDTGFDITSKDSKTPDLVSKYSPDIFGLTQQSKGEYGTIMQPKLVQRIRTKTGAK